MAIDATGPPTALGIPKYNPNVDAPSGLGFNAAMDSIDALIAARVPSPTGVASGEVPVWNGTAWVRSSVTRVGATSLIPSARGIALPAAPYDGQEYVLTDSLTVPSYNWKFRYNAGSLSAYKWEFVGGAPWIARVNSYESTASTVSVDLLTSGPGITIPVAGEYEISWGATVEGSGASVSYVELWDIPLLAMIAEATWSTAGLQSASRTEYIALGAKEYRLRYRRATATAAGFVYRWLSMRPARVA